MPVAALVMLSNADVVNGTPLGSLDVWNSS